MGSKSHQKISKWLIIWLMFSFGLIVSCTTIPTTISSTTLRAILDKVRESVDINDDNNGHDGDLNFEDSISNVDNINNNNNNYSDNKSIDLENAETKDPQKLEIIKQIRKLNHDGSYTVGYEAEDGTFKIESRDVLGNIKGTYGYIDENGDIKRISYTANNTTDGLRTTTLHSSAGGTASTKSSLPNGSPTATPTIRTTSTSTPIEEIVYIPPRPNRTMYSSTTRRPSSLAYLTSPQPPVVSSTKSNVIQSIPKRRMLYSSLTSTTPKTTTTSKTTSTTTTTTTTPSPLKAEPTTTLVYATSVPSSIKPFIRTTPLPSFHYKTAEHQISRPPDRLEIAEQTSKVLHVNSNNNNNQNNRENTIMSSSTTKPVTEIVDESSDQIDDDADDKKSLHGNNLRRQLIDQQQRDNNDNDGDNNDDVDRRRFENQQQFLYSQSNSDDDTSSHVYGPSASVTNRPLFTTTHSSRIPSLVLAARTRAAQIQNILNSQTTEKPYVKPPQRTRPLIYLRRQNDIKESNDNSVDDEDDDDNDGADRDNSNQPTTESTSENTYLTQSPIPSPNRLDSVNAQSNGIDEQRRLMYRRPIYLRQRSREFLRQAPPPGLDFNNGPQQYRIPIPQAAVYQPEHLTQVGRPLGTEQQYLKETTSISPSSPSPLKSHGGVTAAAAEVYPLSENSESGTRASSLHPRSGYLSNQQQQQQQQYDENQLYPIPYINQSPYGPYSANRHGLPLTPIGPQQYYNNNNPDRPLTARDFERILNLLVIRQQQLQRFNGFYPQINPYASSPIMNHLYNPYAGYAGTPPYAGYQQQISRPPIDPYYDPRYYEPFGRENAYQAQQPIPAQQPYTGQRIIQRRKQPQYNPQYMSGATSQNYLTEYPNDQQPSTNQYIDGRTSSSPSSQTFNQNPDYLPPDIREQLLYRMLMLAIQSNNEHNDVNNQEYIAAGTVTKGNTSPISSTSISPLSSSSSSSLSSQPTTSSPLNYRKPIRSVQILGEDE